MILAGLLSSTLLLPVGAWSQAPAGAQMLNLSCVEALAAIGEPRLAGVFSFVVEKDTPQAFADLVMHDKKALKKYAGKLKTDMKDGGVTPWDHEAVTFALQILSSPIADTLDKPSKDERETLDLAARAPVIPLEQLTARRRKG